MRTADGDFFIFHRLAHDFEDARAEFGEFVEEEYAAMGEGDFAGTGPIAAADQARVANGVMWRAEGADLHEWNIRRELVCD